MADAAGRAGASSAWARPVLILLAELAPAGDDALAQPAGPDLLQVGAITLDPATRRVTLAGRQLELTRGEYELLHRLARAPGRVFTKQELLHQIGDQPISRPTRRLDTQVARLRRRLGDHRSLLVTVWGVGYRLGG